MSREREPSHDQSAVISLLTRRPRRYADVARLLAIDERAVAARARGALDALAAGGPAGLARADRELLADYLLGQLGGSSAAAAWHLLATSPAACAWAQDVAAGLEVLAPGTVPELPARPGPGPAGRDRSSPSNATVPRRPAPVRAGTPSRAALAIAAAAPAPLAHAADRVPARLARGRAAAVPPNVASPPSSRVGGAVLLAALAALLVVAIVLITRSGGGGPGVVTGPPSPPATGSAGASPFSVLARSALTPGPAGGSARGVAEIVAEGQQRAIVVAGSRLAPTAGLSRSGFDYTLWVSGLKGAQELGVALPVGADGRLQALGPLPGQPARFQSVLITRETTQAPRTPGPVVLSGRLPSA